MTEDSTEAALQRIEHALFRIEEAANRKVPALALDADIKYQALRKRTHAALASLETVIASVEVR